MRIEGIIRVAADTRRTIETQQARVVALQNRVAEQQIGLRSNHQSNKREKLSSVNCSFKTARRFGAGFVGAKRVFRKASAIR